MDAKVTGESMGAKVTGESIVPKILLSSDERESSLEVTVITVILKEGEVEILQRRNLSLVRDDA